MITHIAMSGTAKFAIVRLLTFDDEQLARSSNDIDAFQRTHSSQPGYAGSIGVDIGSGRRVVVNLWQSEEDATAARNNLSTAVMGLGSGAMRDSELIGAGPLASIDLAAYRPSADDHKEGDDA